MKKIAILRCLKSNDVCTGYACMQAFQHKEGAFKHYGEEPVELMAFFSCNGCGEVKLKQEGLQEKLHMLQRLQLDAIHVGVCTKQIDKEGNWYKCPVIKSITAELEASGIEIVEGTHISRY